MSDRKPSATKRSRNPAKYRQRKPSDMPRRPLSAYNLFFRDERARIVNERNESSESGSRNEGDSGSSEPMVQTIGRLWKNISPEELKRYTDLAEEDTQRYRREMDEYNSRLVERQVKASRQRRVAAAQHAILPGPQPPPGAATAGPATDMGMLLQIPLSSLTQLQENHRKALAAAVSSSRQQEQQPQQQNVQLGVTAGPQPFAASNMAAPVAPNPAGNALGTLISELRRQTVDAQRQLLAQLRQQEQLEQQLNALAELTQQPLPADTQRQVLGTALLQLLGMQQAQLQQQQQQQLQPVPPPPPQPLQPSLPPQAPVMQQTTVDADHANRMLSLLQSNPGVLSALASLQSNTDTTTAIGNTAAPEGVGVGPAVSSAGAVSQSTEATTQSEQRQLVQAAIQKYQSESSESDSK